MVVPSSCHVSETRHDSAPATAGRPPRMSVHPSASSRVLIMGAAPSVTLTRRSLTRPWTIVAKY